MNRKGGYPNDHRQNPSTPGIHEPSLKPGTHRSDQYIPSNPKPLPEGSIRNACQRPPCSRGQRGCGWMQKYLLLFCKTWTALFLASIVCSSLAQPHIMEDGETDPYVQYSHFHQDPSTVERHHLNKSHFLATSDTLFHRNRSESYAARHHRGRPQSRRSALYGRSNDHLYHRNPAATSESLAHSFIEKRQQERPDQRLTQPKDVPSTDRFSDRLPRALTRSQQQKNRSFIEYSAQNDAAQTDDDDVDDTGRPCVYSGHLKTEHRWYGYLANISLAGGTGRLVFEFSYPAESCCQSILFYHEDQLSIMSARTNCWQKEDLLRPDVDQILRLTPSFSWSGCQVKKRPGGDMMVCKGGRSFTKHSYDFQSPSVKEKTSADDKAGQKHRNSDVANNAAVWYIAVSHCASLRGLNLRYKLKVYGHSVPCQADYGNEDDTSSDRENPWPAKNQNSKQTTSKHANESQKKDVDIKQENSIGLPSSSSSSSHSSSSSYQSHRPSDAAHIHLASDEWPVCTIEGSVNTTHSWFGFIRNLSLIDGGGFRFYFSLPYSMSPMNVLLYHDEDIRKLHWEQICWLKESVIESKHVLERIVDLTSRSIYNGCASKTGANIEGNNLTCRGEKVFSGDRNIYIALSNCRSRDGLLLKYKLEVFGYKDHTMCSGGRGIHLERIVENLFFILSIYCSFFFILAVRRIR